MRRDLLPDADVTVVPLATGAARNDAALTATVVAMLCVLAIHGSTVAGMVSVWARSDTFAHGFVILPISAWLAWRDRERWRQVAKRPSWWMLLPILLASLIWLVGELATVNALSEFAVVAMFALAVPLVSGIAAAATVLFPLLFLFFAVPFGEFLLPHLMEWTATFTVAAVKASGVPVYREGLHFVIPSGTWSVVEACSGVRYLIASLMVGALFAFLTYRSLQRRVAFIVVSLLVPIVANWARAYIIVMLGHLSDNRIAAGVDHLIYGWVFFGVVMLLMFWIGARWREDHDPGHAASAAVAAADNRADAPSASRSAHWVAAALCVAAVVAPVLADRQLEAGPSAVPAKADSPLPGEIGNWRAVESTIAWRPHYGNPNGLWWQQYREGESEVGMVVAYYRDQSRERKLVTSTNELAPTSDSRWARIATESREADYPGGRLGVQASTLRSPSGERLRVWLWYAIDGRTTASDAVAKLLTARAQLLQRGDASAAVIIATPVTPAGIPAADALLARFAAPVVPLSRQLLSSIEGSR